MTACTDDERRRVAERLRELGKLAYCPDNTYELMADALGVDDFEGTDELFARLADLIEPSESGQNLDRNQDSVQKESPIVQIEHECDRDALLALADEMDAEKGFEPPRNPHTYPSRFVRVELLYGYASRIREACGEVA